MTADTRHEIQEKAKELKARIRDLVAMSPKRDPFYIGSDLDYEKAQWFRRMWDTHAWHGLHLRGFHYAIQRLAGPDPDKPDPLAVRRPDGQVYVNTDACWSYLKDTFLLARWLGELPFGVVRDKKSPVGAVWMDTTYPYSRPRSVTFEDGVHGVAYAPEIEWESVEDYAKEEAHRIAEDIFLVVEYDSRPYQPYYLSVWSEKDLDEIRYGCSTVANFIPNVGQGTMENADKELRRIREADKPAIIFYLSDFDPKGWDMPVSISRFFEMKHQDGDPRIRLVRLAVTPEQVFENQLPRSPIKKAKATASTAGARSYATLRDVFQAVHGEGQVELDAVIGEHRGMLRRWVEDALSPWVDHDLKAKVEQEVEDLKERVEKRVYEAILEKRPDLEEIRGRLGGKVDQLAAIHEKTVAQLDLETDLETLSDLLEAVKPDLDLEPDFTEGEASGANHDWLLDTDRTYDEQLVAYKGYDMREG